MMIKGVVPLSDFDGFIPVIRHEKPLQSVPKRGLRFYCCALNCICKLPTVIGMSVEHVSMFTLVCTAGMLHVSKFACL